MLYTENSQYVIHLHENSIFPMNMVSGLWTILNMLESHCLRIRRVLSIMEKNKTFLKIIF